MIPKNYAPPQGLSQPFKRALRMRLKGFSPEAIKDRTGYYPAATFVQFLDLNRLPVFEAVLR